MEGWTKVYCIEETKKYRMLQECFRMKDFGTDSYSMDELYSYITAGENVMVANKREYDEEHFCHTILSERKSRSVLATVVDLL